jgi:hypothetical protein
MNGTLTCLVCGRINPGTATECENPRCRSILLPETHKVSPDHTPILIAKGGTRHIEHTLLLYVQGSNESIEVELGDSSELIIGRYDSTTGTAPDVDLADYDAKEKGVSRKHAVLTYLGDLLKISDLASANSTYLNGQRLIPHQPRIIRNGDRLTLGTLALTVQFGKSNPQD